MPLVLKAEGLDQIVLKQLGLPVTRARTEAWEELVDRIKNPTDEVTIHVVGKYTGYEDSYKSLNEAVYHGGFAHRASVKLQLGRGRSAREGGRRRSCSTAPHGILVPGGFGSRGTRGMMKAAEYAREHSVPFFGICYGFQWATVEFARNVCGLEGADSTEVDENAPHKVIYKLRDLLGVDELGGTMRLGRYACELAPGLGGRAHLRHVAHPRAAPPPLRVQLPLRIGARPTRGMRVSGRSPDGKFVEIAELPSHPWFVAVQFHPEFQSRPLRPHPLFASFVGAALQHKAGHARAGQRLGGRALAGVRLLDDAGAARDAPVRVGPLTIGGGAPARLHRRPLRHREPGARARTWRCAIKEIAARCGVPVVFKASFDKANRTSGTSFRGPGLDAGLRGARRGEGRAPGCRSSPTSTSRRRRRRRPRSPTCCRSRRSSRARPTCSWPPRAPARWSTSRRASSWRPPTCGTSSPRSRPRATPSMLVTERGVSFGYNNLVVDMRAFPMLRALGYPVVFDVTHSLQLPGAGDGVTAGLAEYIEPLASAGVAAGVDAVFMEVHEDPSRAKSDARQRAAPRSARGAAPQAHAHRRRRARRGRRRR